METIVTAEHYDNHCNVVYIEPKSDRKGTLHNCTIILLHWLHKHFLNKPACWKTTPEMGTLWKTGYILRLILPNNMRRTTILSSPTLRTVVSYK